MKPHFAKASVLENKSDYEQNVQKDNCFGTQTMLQFVNNQRIHMESSVVHSLERERCKLRV